jgi:hypothetical protein
MWNVLHIKGNSRLNFFLVKTLIFLRILIIIYFLSILSITLFLNFLNISLNNLLRRQKLQQFLLSNWLNIFIIRPTRLSLNSQLFFPTLLSLPITSLLNLSIIKLLILLVILLQDLSSISWLNLSILILLTLLFISLFINNINLFFIVKKWSMKPYQISLTISNKNHLQTDIYLDSLVLSPLSINPRNQLTSQIVPLVTISWIVYRINTIVIFIQNKTPNLTFTTFVESYLILSQLISKKKTISSTSK